MPEPLQPKMSGVVGWPISQSLSPLIHGTWAAREGLNAWYVPIAVEPDYAAFEKTANSLKNIGFSGFNVTMPHKENALRYCDNVSPTASAAGAANMVSFTNDGTYADNSDVYGFTQSLKRHIQPADKKSAVLILGAGGAAGGIAIALKSMGFQSLIIANRTQSKSEELARAHDGYASTISWDDKDKAAENVDVIVNTTSLGMSGQPDLELDLRGTAKSTIICDIVYSPLETKLLKAAEDQNLRSVGGLSMLMHQAVPGYKAWLGKKALVDADLEHRLIGQLNERQKP